MSYDFRRSQIVRGIILSGREVMGAKRILKGAEDRLEERLDSLMCLDAENGIETLKDETTYTPLLTGNQIIPITEKIV